MGLNIAVGVLSNAEENSAESIGHFVKQFRAINEHLRKAGIEEHTEPTEVESWSAQLHGYTGLHYLRRIAGHLQFGNKPEPGDDSASDDPIIDKYSKLALKKASIFTRLLGGDVPQRFFDHLMLHSDAEGYYLPIDFEEVQFTDGSLEIDGCMVGSSYQLLVELKRAAEYLELPYLNDIETDESWDASASPQNEGAERWQKYGIESFCCARLIRGAEISIETGAALVFC